MNNMIVLEEILKELHELEWRVTDKYIKCAVQANLIRYKRDLEKEREKNALRVVEHKIKHLTSKLKT